MKKLAIAALLGMVSATTFAAQGDIIARLRVINVSPQDTWDNNGTVAGLNVQADDAWAPELDFTYMFTNNIGAELILGTTRHKVTTNTFGGVGKVSVLPPTLTLQYHFLPEANFRPYAGVGVNYTRFYSQSLAAYNPDGSYVTDLSVKKNSFGPALQIGADLAINKDWFINFDLKKIWIKTDVKADNLAGQPTLGTLKINPWVFGVGIGTKF